MSTFNRRQWLKAAGLTGAFSFLGGLESLATEIPGPAKNSYKKGTAIKLSSNENPYGPSQKVREAIIQAFDKAHQYPFDYIKELLHLIAEKDGVKPENIVLCCGSTEGLRITGLTYGLDRGEIITVEPTFKALTDYAERFGTYINRVALDENLQYDLEEIEKRITLNTRLIFLCNPNNPTGQLLPADDLRKFVDAVSGRTVVFSDEAYIDYITEPNYPSMVEMVKEGKNVIVSRTFSKVYGLAGIRIGYLIAREDIVKRLRGNIVGNTSIPGIFAAKAALQDKEFYRYSLQQNEACKKIIYSALDELGLRYLPSHSNFVFFQTGRDIHQLNKTMLEKGVRIGRPFPPMTDWARISTGRVEDVEEFVKVLKMEFS